MIEIVVPHQIRKKEIPHTELADATKLFAKLKVRPDLATDLTAKGLPERTSLFKVYATTAHGARRLLFFYRRPAPPPADAPGKSKSPAQAQPAAASSPERWVLLFYRDKNDAVGKNMSPSNPNFEPQLGKNLELALDDLAKSTATGKHYDTY